MGRLFEEPNKTSTTSSKKTTSRLFPDSETKIPKKDALDKAYKIADTVGDFLGGNKIGEAIGSSVAKKKTIAGEDIKLADYSRLTPEAKKKLKAKGVPITADAQLKESAAKIPKPTNAQITADVAKIGLNFLPYGKISNLAGAATLGSAAKLTPQALKAAQLTGEVVTGVAGGLSVGAANSVAAGKTGRDVAKEALLGGFVGGALPIAIRGVGRLFSKKATPAISGQVDDVVATSGKTPTISEAPRLVDSKGKLGLRETMENLNDVFNTSDTVKIMKKLQEISPDEKYTIQQIKEAADSIKPNIYAPYVPDEQLPTIGFNATTRSKPGITNAMPEGPIPSTNTAGKVSTGLPRSIKGTKITKEAQNIDATLVKEGFDSLPADQKAMFTPITEADQIQRVYDAMNTDIVSATESAITGKNLPAGVHPQVLFNAVKKKALQDDDVFTLMSLAKSPIAKQESLAGQTLRASQILNDTDPIKLIQEVNTVRNNPVKVAAEAAAIEKQISNSKITRPTFAEFIRSIEC